MPRSKRSSCQSWAWSDAFSETKARRSATQRRDDATTRRRDDDARCIKNKRSARAPFVSSLESPPASRIFPSSPRPRSARASRSTHASRRRRVPTTPRTDVKTARLARDARKTRARPEKLLNENTNAKRNEGWCHLCETRRVSRSREPSHRDRRIGCVDVAAWRTRLSGGGRRTKKAKATSDGDRTHDPCLRKATLYPLSYRGCSR